MKAAFDWKAQKNRARGVEGGADKILHFREAFHGRSGYTLSVTNTEPLKVADFPKFDWPRIANPKIPFPRDEAAVAAAEAQAITEIDRAFERDPHGIAAILIEPIQCEGGDNHFRPEFLQQLRRIADERDALLIFDEVQTGMGVTGSMWAYQQMGATPDLLAFGKKTQVCGVMAGPRIDEVESNVFHVSSRINSTWGGNLVDMVRCARYLEIMHEEKLVENAAMVGGVFLDLLQELEAEFPQVTNARGRGLLLAFDLPDTETRNRVRQACWDSGFATLACGPRSVRFRPALIFSEADVERAGTILRDVLAR
jgi:L-lysine 6-transaminase